uniref:F-box domain-containing protein n=1 Tax=Tetradesmus obliquus TaxID=3088 RepID=A0A383VST5_TETOB|eukprot:jgi/Sobl393_1/15464/SZX67879.1
MDKLIDILQLCLARLSPHDVCMLRCTCSELHDEEQLEVSWQGHSIDFKLDGSASATSWLQMNIHSMNKLSVSISFSVPRQVLQDVMEGGRNLTCLTINSQHVEELPALPPQLQQLDLKRCSQLHVLPALPPTLRQLSCGECRALEALPSSLSTTAATKLSCSRCCCLKSLPQLPPSLVELQAFECTSLAQLPALPGGLERLDISNCKALSELLKLPASLAYLSCSGCSLLRKLPQLAHTGLSWTAAAVIC